MTKIPPFGCDVRKASAEQKREFLELLDRYENNEYGDLKGSLAYYGIDTDQDVAMFDDEKPALLWFTRIIPIEQGIAILNGEEEKPRDTVLLPKKLTAENGAKGLLVGEFFETIEVQNEGYCGCGKCDFCKEFPDETETITQQVPVSWSTIKDIYDKIVIYYEANPPKQ